MRSSKEARLTERQKINYSIQASSRCSCKGVDKALIPSLAPPFFYEQNSNESSIKAISFHD